jgi:hypothetical protein
LDEREDVLLRIFFNRKKAHKINDTSNSHSFNL